MKGVTGRVWMPLLVIGMLACGGESNTAPAPPPGTANQVPRVLAITLVNGKNAPAVAYTWPDGFDTRSDSGSVTLQDDSMLVVRTYYTDVQHGQTVGGRSWGFTTAGVLDPFGMAVMRYTDGTADTARVLSNGSVVASLTMTDGPQLRRSATLDFASPYQGVALNPLVRVRGFSPAQGMVGSANVTLVVMGSHFMPSTTFQWGSTVLNVTYVSASQISVDVPSWLLAVAGPVSVKIGNPGPGGGDRIYTYDVVSPLPVVGALSPATVLQGSSAFTLQVTGSNFTNKSVVMWNGVPRPTTYVSSTQLTASILAGDIGTTGAVQVTVQTPPPGGGTSNVAGFAIVTATEQALAEVSATFAAYRLAADPVRPLVYASAMVNDETHYPNSIVALDPGTGQVSWSLALGKPIIAIAVSDDGQYLYVSYMGDLTMTRVALATHTVDATFDIGSGSGGPYEGVAMAVMPGHPHSVAVARAGYLSGPGVATDFAIYDDGVPRANRLTGSAAPPQFIFAPDGSIYGITQNGVVEDIVVDASGVTVRSSASRSVLNENFQIIGTRVYSSLGALYDPVTGMKTPVPAFTPSGAMTSSADGRFLYAVGGSGPYLRAFDVMQDAPAGSVQLTGNWALAFYSPVVRWGADGIAYAVGGNVYFVRASVVH